MSRKGWSEEYSARQILDDKFGRPNVIKVAISQFGADFICLEKGRISLVVEVKGRHSKKYYANKEDLAQFERIKEFCLEHNCRGEIWIKYPYKEFEIKEINKKI